MSNMGTITRTDAGNSKDLFVNVLTVEGAQCLEGEKSRSHKHIHQSLRCLYSDPRVFQGEERGQCKRGKTRWTLTNIQ